MLKVVKHSTRHWSVPKGYVPNLWAAVDGAKKIGPTTYAPGKKHVVEGQEPEIDASSTEMVNVKVAIVATR